MESLSAVVLDMKMSSPSSSSSSIPKKTLSMKQMLLLNAVVCGVEICACAGFTYIPPMLLKAGFAEERMGFILGSGPLFGFFLVPVIGRASDRCYSQYGRRRPFILGIAIFLVVSLYLIPFGEYFASLIVGVSGTSKRLGVWGLAIGVILLDFTTQACLTPCEALLNDAAKDTDRNEKIFTIYSLMISLGGVIGYLLTAIDWTANPLGDYFGGQEASIFSFLIVIFTMMLSATLFVAQETPLSKSKVDEDVPTIGSSNSLMDVNHGVVSRSLTEPNNENSVYSADEDSITSSPRRQKGSSSTRQNYINRMFWTCMNYLPFQGRFITNACGCLFWLSKQLFPKELRQLFLIPSVLKILALSDFCCWTAIMGFNIYYTDFVGQIVYGGNPNAPENSAEGKAYDEGVRIASWGLLLHCICSAVFSFFIEHLTDTYGYKTTMVMGMTTFVSAMMGMVLVRHVIFVNLMAAVTGFAYSTITTIPFMLVSKYHANKKIYFNDLPASLLGDTERGIGSDMAVLDWSYFLSQVVLTVTMGGIVHVTGTVISYMVSAGIFGILAVYCIGNIVEDEAGALKLARRR